jgi:hypothetical protein
VISLIIKNGISLLLLFSLEFQAEQLWHLIYHHVQLYGLKLQMLDEELLYELEMVLDLLQKFEMFEVKKVLQLLV